MFEYWLETDLQKLPMVKPLGNVFSQDSGANKIGVILPAAAYTAVGQIGVYLKLITENETTTLGGVEGYVNKSR